MSQPLLIKSVAGCHCPKCRQGNLFQSSTFNLKRFSDMNEKCEVCGQTFMPEPSFYMGAMFVSYALQIGLFLTIYFSVRAINPNASLELYMGVMTSLVILTLPLVYRLSRSIWIHLMVKYQQQIDSLADQSTTHESSSL